MSRKTELASRRTVIKSGAAAFTAGAVGVGALRYSSRPSLAASIDVWDAGADVSITTTDGTVDAINIDPTVTIQYANLDPDQTAEVRIFPSHEEQTVSATMNAETTLAGRSGEETVEYGQTDLTALNNFDETPLFADQPGASNTTQISLRLDVRVPDQAEIDQVEETDVFNVTITNAQPETTVSATSSTVLVSSKEV